VVLGLEDMLRAVVFAKVDTWVPEER